jgi:glycosyltransferase involved in cell wall biosynthesis
MKNSTGMPFCLPNSDSRKVLFFVHFGDHQLRGSERCILNIANGLDRSKFRVVLWCNHESLADLAREMNIEVVLTNFLPPFGFNYFHNFIEGIQHFVHLLGATRRHLNTLKPDLILCNSLAPCQWMVPLSLLYNIPLIAYLHTNYLPKSRLLSLAFGASHMVGVSNFTLERFQDDGFPSSLSSVVYNGVDDLALVSSDRAEERSRLGIGENEFTILSICALVDWKKVELIIQAFALLNKTSANPSVLLIVGDGPLRGHLEEKAAGLRVIFCGWRSDVANVYAAADCVVVAAEREAFCLTAIEGAAMGKPTVAAKAGGLMELIRHQENGLFATPGSAASFAESLRALRDDPVFRINLSKASRAEYEKEFKSEHMVSNMELIIQKVLHAHHTKTIHALHRLLNLFRLSIRSLVRRLIKKSKYLLQESER